MDEQKNRMPDHRRFISLSAAEDIEYWKKALGCTEAELTAAVQEVGNNADKVRAFLKRD